MEDDTVIITITDKVIKVVDNQSKYLIFTENETFEESVGVTETYKKFKINNKMIVKKKCPKCNIAMVEGIAIDPVGFEGNCRYISPPPLLNSETLKVIKCLKCPVCGLSESTINNDQDERKDMH